MNWIPSAMTGAEESEMKVMKAASPVRVSRFASSSR